MILDGSVIVSGPFPGILTLAEGCHADAAACVLNGTYTNDRTHFRVVSCPRCRDDVYTFYLIRFQVLEFAGIMHLPVVDVYFRCAFGKDREIAVITFNAWQHRDDIVCRSHILQ